MSFAVLMNKQYLYTSAMTASLIAALLIIVQVVPSKPLLLMERLIPAGGWIQVVIAVIYGALLCYKMQDRKKTSEMENKSLAAFLDSLFRTVVVRYIG